MHIIIGGLIALGTIFWAISRIMDGASEVKMAQRSVAWQKNNNEKLVDTLTDPRQSAVILMLQVAQYEGDLTAQQRASITNEMLIKFQTTRDQAEELLGFSRIALGQIGDAAKVIGKVLAPLRTHDSTELNSDLITMLTTIGKANGKKLNPQQESFIHQVDRALG